MAASRDGRGGVRKRTNADGSVSFEAYGRRGGKKKYLATFPSKKLAEHAVDDDASLQRKIRRGEAPAEMDVRRTFEDVAKEWITDEKRARSVRGYKSELERYVYPTMRDVPIASLTTKALEALQERLKARPGLSARTVAHAMSIAASIARYAWQRGFIASNPAVGFSLVRFPERTFNWIRTRAEIEQLLAETADPHRTIFATLVLTGMRRNEALYLQWEDVDLAQRLICIQRGPHGSPKGKRLRYVPVSDSLLPVLRRWRLLSGKATGLVFPGPRGKVRFDGAVTKLFKRSLERAGLDQSIRLHDLRHTYASHFVRDGGDIFRLSKYLGHATVLITERTYAHLMPDDYSKDWGRVSVRVQFDEATIVTMVGEREDARPALTVLDGRE